MVFPRHDIPPLGRDPLVVDRDRPPLLAELAADVPVALLPVRVETRWFPGPSDAQLELRIRIYPDEIHVTAPVAPSGAERDDVAAYWAIRAADGDGAESTARAWRGLVERHGGGRAAYLVRTLAPGAPRPTDDDDDGRARALPARWHAILRGPGFRLTAASEPVRADLRVAPEPGDTPGAAGPPLGSAMAWVSEWKAARDAGMAIAMTVPRADAARLDELIVLGVASTATPEDGARTLGALLGRHAAGAGIALVAPGTPTNHGETTRAGDQGDRPLGDAPAAGSDGARLTAALGLAPDALRDAVGDGGSRDAIARAMNAVLWPSTLGHFLDTMAARSAAERARGRALFVEHVRPQGPLVGLRVRRQPYGVLPATALGRWPAAQPGGGLAHFLDRVAARWMPATARVPRLVDAGDPDRALVAFLRRSPHAVHFALRPATTRAAAAVAATGLGAAIANAIAAVERASAAIANAVAMADLGVDGAVPALELVYEDDALRITVPLVAPASAPRDAALAPSYLAAIADATDAALEAHQVAGAEPRTLLYLLARQATVQVRAAHVDRVLATAIEIRDEHRVRPAPAERVWARMRRVPVATVLADPAVAAHHDALRALAAAPVDELERAAAATLDACSHRVDAWATALASERLAALRAARPHATYVGGWAWLERPRPGAALSSLPSAGGFLHAPSLAQARTAAALRSAFDAHRTDGTGTSLAIDLSSARVRDARWLLDGVRAGRSLGRLLGDRLERWLESHQGAGLIADLRRRFPAAGDAAAPLVDGWKVHQAWTAQPPTGVASGAAAMLTAVIDAAADLLLADAVHHVVAGNPGRAGAALDALERGEATVPDPHVDRVDVDGPLQRVRVALALAERPGWPAPPRPRAVAAPLLEGFAADVLGDPRAIALGGGRTVADLGLCALDVVALADGGDPARLSAVAGATTDALDELVVRAAAVARLFRAARTPIAGDLGPRTITAPPARGPAIAAALAAIDPATAPTAAAALAGAPLVGDATALAAAYAALRARVSAAADPARELLGDGVPDAALVDGWPAGTAPDALAHAAWLAELGRVRPGVEALDLIALVAPAALGAALTSALPEVTLVGVGATAAPAGALVVDGWTESAPAAELTTGAAFAHDAPRGQPPQAILLAVPPPATPWSLELLEATIGETAARARLRVIDPADVHGQLAPALHVADDPAELTASTDLLLVAAFVNTLVSP